MDNATRKALVACGANDTMLHDLGRYAALILQWNKAINLVAPSTLGQIWQRHILDSAQLWPVMNSIGASARIVDLGSGGGLPGIVLAIGGFHVTMVESDLRKCIFLRETARELKLQHCVVLNQRIETVDIAADIVTARALAPLSQLAAWSRHILRDKGASVFLKGANAVEEIKALPAELQQKITIIPSMTDSDARIIQIQF